MGRTFAGILCLCYLAISQAKEPSPQQREEWQRLYPKLNSKMARMEELLNFIDRFTGDSEFKPQMLEKAIEFRYLAKISVNNIPAELPAEELERYKKALCKTSKLGSQLYTALKDDQHDQARELFKQLDKVRRNSHSKWAN